MRPRREAFSLRSSRRQSPVSWQVSCWASAGVMVAGNQARMPKGITRGVRTLTSNIVLEMGYAADLHREALIATGVVLFVFILLINLCVAALKRQDAK